jgi:YidC/Oxa1 family membrane protein insertase
LDIGALWYQALVQPLEQMLIALATFTGSAGWAIILFTIGVKLLLFPLTWKQIQGQKSMMVIQPQIREAQKKYGKDRVKLNEEMMRIYKENNANPASGCLPLVIQLPIWFALYQALSNLGSQNELFQQGFFWISRLDQPDTMMLPFLPDPIPNPLLPVLTAFTQLLIQRMMTPPTVDPQMAQMNRTMQFMPIIFLFFSFNFPAGLVLYWVTSNLVSMVQQYFLTGWGGLFPGSQKPNTPFAGSWDPKPLRRPERPAEPSEGGEAGVVVLSKQGDAPAGDAPRAGDRPANGRRDGGGRNAPRGGKEKRRGAKR